MALLAMPVLWREIVHGTRWSSAEKPVRCDANDFLEHKKKRAKDHFFSSKKQGGWFMFYFLFQAPQFQVVCSVIYWQDVHTVENSSVDLVPCYHSRSTSLISMLLQHQPHQMHHHHHWTFKHRTRLVDMRNHSFVVNVKPRSPGKIIWRSTRSFIPPPPLDR